MRELSFFIERHGCIQILSTPDEGCNFRKCHINRNVIVYLDGYIGDSSCLGNQCDEKDILKLFYHTILRDKRYDKLATLNGHYNIIVVDQQTNDIHVVTDRFALRPFFLCKTSKGIVLSTSVKMISDRDDFDGIVNHQALFDFIKFEFVLEAATFFKNINRLNPATINNFNNDGRMISQQYMNWNGPEEINHNSVNENAEIVFSLLEKAVQRTLHGVALPAVTISGGLDSRIIAGLLAAKQGYPPEFFHCPFSVNEERGAKGVVDLLGGKMNSLPMRNVDIRFLTAPIEYGDGCTALNQFWLFDLFKEKIAPCGVDCVFDGFYLDMLLLPPHEFMHYGKALFERGLMQNRSIIMDKIYGLYSGYYDKYFFDSDYQNMNDMALARAGRYVKDIETEYLDPFYRFQYMKTRGDRYVLPMANTNQNFCDIRFPGLDYDLIDFCMTLPSNQIQHPEVYLQIFKKFLPELFLIEWARTGKPLIAGLEMFERKKNNIISSLAFYLQRITFGRVDYITPPKNKNYLFRKNVVFREAVLNLFCNHYCIEQGLIGKKGFNKLVRNILIGKNDFSILERLMAIERFFIEFIER